MSPCVHPPCPGCRRTPLPSYPRSRRFPLHRPLAAFTLEMEARKGLATRESFSVRSQDHAPLALCQRSQHHPGGPRTAAGHPARRRRFASRQPKMANRHPRSALGYPPWGYPLTTLFPTHTAQHPLTALFPTHTGSSGLPSFVFNHIGVFGEFFISGPHAARPQSGALDQCDLTHIVGGGGFG